MPMTTPVAATQRGGTESPTQNPPGAGGRSNLFICFAAEERDFVRHLDEQLRKRRRVSSINWRKSDGTQDTSAEVLKLIEAAETFIFVVSPFSVASEGCRRQLLHAAGLGKVVVPVVRVRVTDGELPAPLARLPLIDYRPEVDEIQAFGEVVKAVNTNLRIDAFICYSRDDGGFVQRLYRELDENGRRVWLDLSSIPVSTRWEKEIYAGIEAADNFVFVISPSSLRPESFCRKELEHAHANNKRIIPLLHRAVPDPDIPPALAQYQREEFPADGDFARNFANLLSVLDQDPAYLREHTRLLTRSIEWQRTDDGAGNRDESLLLRGDDLTRAETLLSTSANKRPQFTNLQTQYVVASRQGANRSRNRLLTWAAVALVALALLSVGLLFQTRAANAATQEAQRQQGIAEGQRTEATKQRDIARQKQQEAEIATGEANAQKGIAQRKQVEADQARGQAEKRRIEAENERRRAVEAAEKERRAREVAEIRGLRAEAGRQEAANNPLSALAVYRAADKLSSAHKEEKSSGELSRLLQQAGQGRVLESSKFNAKVFALSSDGEKLAVTSGDGQIHVWDLSSGKLSPPIDAYKKEVTALAFSPSDNNLLASTGTDDFITTVKTWNVETRKQGAPLPGEKYCCGWRKLQFVGDRYLLSDDNVWDLQAGRHLKLQIPAEQMVSALAVSNDGKQIVAGLLDRNLKGVGVGIYDVSNGEKVRALEGTPAEFRTFAFSQNDYYVAAVTDKHELRVWGLTDGKEIPVGYGNQKPVQVDFLAFSTAPYSDSTLVTAWGGYVPNEPGNFVVWDIRYDGVLFEREVAAHKASVTGLMFSPDGSRLATASSDHTIAVWETRSWTLMQSLQGHQGPVRQLSFLPGGGSLVSNSDDGAVRVWQLLDKINEREIENAQIIEAMSEDGKRAAAVYFRKQGEPYSDAPEIIDLETMRHLSTIPVKSASFSTYSFSRDDRRLAGIARDLSVSVWDADNGQLIDSLPGYRGETSHPLTAFSDDMSRVANSQGSHAQVRDIEAKRTVLDLDSAKTHPGLPRSPWVYALAISPDGERVAIGYDKVPNGQVEVWRYADGKFNLEGSADLEGGDKVSVSSLAFSQDGRLLAIGGSDGALTLRDNESGKLGEPRREHYSGIDGIRWPRTGTFLVTLSKTDSTAKVWNTSPSLTLVQTFERGSEIANVVISDDGTRLLTMSDFKMGSIVTFRAWDTRTGNMLDKFEAPGPPAFFQQNERPAFIANARRIRFYANFRYIYDWMTQPPDDDLFRSLGLKTNLRVCRDTYRVVPVLPYPGPSTIWAPQPDCAEAAR